MKYTYTTKGTCSSEITFDIDNSNTVTNIKFTGGCSGNLKAVSLLTDGWTAQQIADKLSGNLCGSKSTSCADQLAKAVLEASEKIGQKANA